MADDFLSKALWAAAWRSRKILRLRDAVGEPQAREVHRILDEKVRWWDGDE